MQKLTDVILVQSATGTIPFQGATISVTNYPSGSAATIYSDNGITPIGSSTTSDATGRFFFYAANGHYTLTITATGYATVVINDVLFDDPGNAYAGLFTTINATGAVTVGGLISANGGLLVASGQPLTLTGVPVTGGTFSSATLISPSISSLQLQNRIINPGMAIDQRNSGGAQTFTAGAALAYSVDRWYGYCTGGNVTGQRVAGSLQSQFRYQFTGGAAVSAIGFAQRIEAANSYDMNGQTCTLSVDLSNSLLTTVTWTAYYANSTDTFGTLGAPTKTLISTGSFTVTTTLARYSTTISVPAAATTGIEILFTVGAQTSGTLVIGNAQFEPGNFTTTPAFTPREVGVEKLLCQYYHNSVRCAAADNGASVNTKQYYAPISFQPMRAAPSVTYTPITSTLVTSRVAQNITAFGFTHVVTASGAASMFEESNAVLDAEL